MPRPRKSAPSVLSLPPHLAAWAESVGEALGRGVARGINLALNLPQGQAAQARRRGRPPKAAGAAANAVAAGRQCSVQGCTGAVRSKGMCSAHYQAARRRALQAGGEA